MHVLWIYLSALLICGCVIASVILVVHFANRKAPVRPLVTPLVPPVQSPVQSHAPPSTATAPTRWDPVVISTSEIKPGEPGYFVHEGPTVSVSTVIGPDGVEVVVEDDPPLDFGLND